METISHISSAELRQLIADWHELRTGQKVRVTSFSYVNWQTGYRIKFVSVPPEIPQEEINPTAC